MGMSKEEYYERKALGLCVYSSGCADPPGEDLLKCATHAKKCREIAKSRNVQQRESHRIYRKTHKFKKRMAKRLRRCRLAFVCFRCGKPAHGTYCDLHSRKYVRDPSKPLKRTMHCSGCGLPDHNIQTCKNWPIAPMPTLADIVSRRSYDESRLPSDK